jgi:putative glycosyltransferase (TIGR04372 family)
MAAIIARGGWCVRMGDSTMRPLEPMDRVIDYARSAAKSDWMDIFLCAQSRFFLGTSSGLICVSGIFGRPNVVTNIVPLAGCYSMFPSDIIIPKRLANSDGRILSFPEIFASDISELRLSPEYDERKITLISNTPAEILALTTELMDRLDGVDVDTDEDKMLQEQFRSLVEPHHFSWGARSRVGKAFLREHKDLLTQAVG